MLPVAEWFGGIAELGDIFNPVIPAPKGQFELPIELPTLLAAVPNPPSVDDAEPPLPRPPFDPPVDPDPPPIGLGGIAGLAATGIERDNGNAVL